MDFISANLNLNSVPLPFSLSTWPDSPTRSAPRAADGDAVFGVGADCFRHSAPVAGADGAVFVGRAGRGTVFGCVLVKQAGVSVVMGRRGVDAGGDLSGFGQATLVAVGGVVVFY